MANNYTNFILGDPIVINNKNGLPVWDMYELEMQDQFHQIKKINLFTEHNGIDMSRTTHEVQKYFFIQRLFGEQGLIAKQGRENFIFLGRLDYQNGKYKASRFYPLSYTTLNAQEYFDSCLNILISEISKSTLHESQDNKEISNILNSYHITWDEYQALLTYMGPNYFIPTTLLHEVDFKQINKMPFEDPMAYLDFWSYPKNVIQFYERLYSLGCKCSLNSKKIKNVYRVCSHLYKNEMEKSGVTSSFLSFSKDNISLSFMGTRNNSILLNGTIKQGTPYIDTNLLKCASSEQEILVPPFQKIVYSNMKRGKGDYHVVITHSIPFYSKREEYEMKCLEEQVLKTDIIRVFYEEWYCAIRNQKTFNEDIQMEFRNWQRMLKRYLNLYFQKIEQDLLNSSNGNFGKIVERIRKR